MKNLTQNVWSRAKRLLLVTGMVVGLAGTLALPPEAKAGLNDWAPMSVQDQAQFGFNYVGVFDATNWIQSVTNAFNANGNTLFPRPLVGTVNFPAGTRIRNLAVKVVKAVSTANGATAVALSIGDSTTSNRFCSGLTVGTNVGTGVLSTNADGLWGYNGGTAGSTWYTLGTTNFVYNTATNILLWFTPTGDSVPNITNGRLEFYLNAVDLNGALGR